jgi:ATP-dependent protease ClpP protease subunit
MTKPYSPDEIATLIERDRFMGTEEGLELGTVDKGIGEERKQRREKS